MNTSRHPEPSIVERDEQPYVAVKGTVTMKTIGEVADRFGELFGWLSERGVEPAGAPFLKYNLIDMEDEVEVEAGVPVSVSVDGDGDVFSGVLPAGRYVTLTHVGHPDGLLGASDSIMTWAAEQGLTWDVADTPKGRRWACRIEQYETDPSEESELEKWETVLAFRLAD